jgi:hypothetical protein
VGSNPAEAVGFFLMEKSSACLPSEGKSNNLSHVPTLGHAKFVCTVAFLRMVRSASGDEGRNYLDMGPKGSASKA